MKIPFFINYTRMQNPSFLLGLQLVISEINWSCSDDFVIEDFRTSNDFQNCSLLSRTGNLKNGQNALSRKGKKAGNLREREKALFSHFPSKSIVNVVTVGILMKKKNWQLMNRVLINISSQYYFVYFEYSLFMKQVMT